MTEGGVSSARACAPQERKEYDTVEEHYERALLLKPNHLQTLCCYGSFLRTVREDPQVSCPVHVCMCACVCECVCVCVCVCVCNTLQTVLLW